MTAIPNFADVPLGADAEGATLDSWQKAAGPTESLTWTDP